MATVASLMGDERFRLHAEWDRPEGIAAPELAATWCALDIRVDGLPVTLVEDLRGGGLRRAVHTSAYPLAEWLAHRWWLLNEHLRPSAVPSNSWLWRQSPRMTWLQAHNLRGAGDGMPWPDLTLVPEGAVTRAVWWSGPGLAGQPLSFLTAGKAYLPAADVRVVLATFVERVLERLREVGLHNTPLQQEWRALADLDDEERAFAKAAARLGLDPFGVDEGVAEQIEHLAHTLEPDLLDEFLDSAAPDRLPVAVEWLGRARDNHRPVGAGTERIEATDVGVSERPWSRGYAAARVYREGIGLEPTDPIDLRERVGLSHIEGDPAGLLGFVGVTEEGVGLVLPSDFTGAATTKFAQARALGLALLTPRRSVLLDMASTDLVKMTRAFAAELLAPADGIAEYLSVLPAVTDRAIDAIADRYGASPIMVQRQYENQLI